MIENLAMHLIIRRAVTKRPEHLLDDARLLWERFSVELVPIIGEGGFESLYTRSFALTCASYPWLLPIDAADNVGGHSYIPFSGLTSTFKKRDANETSEAIITLFIVFTDTLATLIGASLTSRILATSWGDDAIDLSGTE